MFFPVAEVDIAIWYLVGIGFAVGVCGGFWGMGGGWITTPALFALGVPMNVAVGTGLAQMVGQSVVATFWHGKFGNVSVRVAAVMIPGTILGVEIGARIMEYLKAFGQVRVDEVISILYIILLSGLAVYTLVESVHSQRTLARDRTLRAQGGEQETGADRDVEDRVTVDLARRLQHFRIPPMICCPLLRVERISAWIVFVAAVLTGVLAGLLGVGGGFLRVPVLVYLIGCPTHVAVGTDLFAIIISGGYGSFTHALKGNVDLMIALSMLLGAVLGAPLGSFATRYVQGAQLRALFGAALVAATASIIVKHFCGMPQLAIALAVGMAGLMAAIIIGLLVRGVIRTSRVA